ncbi:ABC transporter ATP-binding protein [Lutibaculum baratangense]|uniref:ABC transporter ATP-binding protein n=1 Tax=Lutibaculum baratangense AMV1 TaxID=631454 RepID=V4QVG0_9HYPH|nr:ABC transporter ATP-binding protein [Lutibaculum baratangense]ESR23752.1 ABC transporter ATP-binding protein [Lutibaculum baratangense AMV1]
MSDAFLSIRGLRKEFGSFVAVEEVNIDIARGEFLTFLGPSGSGKSTTLYALAGFQQPTSGDILLEGRSVLPTPSHKRNIGMVFQRYTLFPHLTVAENVAFPLRVRRLPDARVKARVKEMLALVRLDGFGDRLPPALSGGQQQRVALARALAYDPPVLLMDEPLSALDKKLREEIQIEIKRIHNDTGVTILYVTHDQEEALRLSDRIALFNSGRIEQIGSGETLYRNPASRFVAGFIGNSNFLTAEVAGEEAGSVTARFPDGSVASGIRPHAGVGTGTRGHLMVRPEDLHVAPHDGVGFKTTVEQVTFLGEMLHLAVRTAWGEELSVRTSPRRGNPATLVAGAPVTLSWDGGDAHFFAGAAPHPQ